MTGPALNPEQVESEPSVGRRAATLYAEARALADENVRVFLATLERVITQSDEISQAPELYPAGVREICRKLLMNPAFKPDGLIALVQEISSTNRGDKLAEPR